MFNKKVKNKIKNKVIEFSEVSKSFRHFSLKNINFEVYESECFGILGKNGAGKTTILKLMQGMVKRDEGEIEVLGFDPENDEIKIKELIGYVPEQSNPPSFLTIDEFFDFVSKIRRISPNFDFWYDFFDLKDYKDELILNLSRGTKQKLMFAQAFLHEPRIAIIDEPLVNLDPLTQVKVIDYIKKAVKNGKTVILATHMISLAAKICNRVMILDNGKIKKITKLNGLNKEARLMKEFNSVDKKSNKTHKMI